MKPFYLNKANDDENEIKTTQEQNKTLQVFGYFLYLEVLMFDQKGVLIL